MKNHKLMDEIQKTMYYWQSIASDAVNEITTYSYYENGSHVAYFYLVNAEDRHMYYKLYVYSACDTGNVGIELTYKDKPLICTYAIKKQYIVSEVSCILKNLCRFFD